MRLQGLAYDDAQSSTVTKTTKGAIITFAQGKLAGHFFHDDVSIGTGPGRIVIKNQEFGNVEQQHNIFRSNYQAVVGLAYPQLAEPGVVPVFDNMM